MGADAATTREEPFDYGIDSAGRKYPTGTYGYRIIPGSRRPPGVPPNIWKGLSTKDNMEASTVGKPASEAPAASSSSMIVKQIGTMLECERFHDQWVDEFE